MIKFFVGSIVGAALVYSFLVYPAQSKHAVKTGVDTASSALTSGVSTAKEAADKRLSK